MTVERQSVQFRPATRDDIEAIVRLLADDTLGRMRERVGEPVFDGYRRAFDAVTAQSGNDIVVAEMDGELVGCLQLTCIPGLSRQGLLRAQIEGVRVSSACRGAGVGTRLLEYAVALAREAGCGLVELTSDKTRVRAHRFYAQLGFDASHVGFKLSL